METKILNDEYFEPNDKILKTIFGETGKNWEAIKKHIKDEYSDIKEEWKKYYKKSGWILQVKRKNRTIFWMTPFEGYFCITFWFGAKAVAVIEKSNLPEEIIETLLNAKIHKIGRSIKIEVNQTDDVENVKRLIKIKINN